MHATIITTSTTKTPHTIPIIKGVLFFVVDKTTGVFEQLAFVATHKKSFPSYLQRMILMLKYLLITNYVFNNILYL